MEASSKKCQGIQPFARVDSGRSTRALLEAADSPVQSAFSVSLEPDSETSPPVTPVRSPAESGEELPEDCHISWRAFSAEVIEVIIEQGLPVNFSNPALPQICDSLRRTALITRTLSEAVEQYYEAE